MAVELSNVSYEILSISGGQMRERAPHVSMYQPATRLGRRPARDSLYILVDVTGGARPDLAADLVATVEEEYANHSSRSVTSALISVIKAANDFLYKENLETVLAGRVTASILCAVVREQDVYVGWAGQAPVYLLHDGRIQRVPARPDPADDVNCLGLDTSVEARLFHSEVAPGDMVILGSPDLDRVLTPGQLQGLLGLGTLAAIRAQLISLVGSGDLSVAMIRIKEAPAPAASAQPARSGPGVLDRLKGLRPHRQPAAPARRQPSAPRPERPPRPVARASRPAPVADAPAVVDRPILSPPAARPGRRLPVKPLLVVLVPALLVILAVFGLGWMALSQWQENQAQEAYFASLLVQAEQLRTQAAGQADREARIQTLRQARDVADEALALKPDDPTAAELRQSIQRDLNQASLVTPLYGAILLHDFAAEGSRVSQLWVQDQRVYVLDAGRGILYRYFLNDNRDDLIAQDDPVLLRMGQTVGDRVVESLQFILWMPAGADRQEGILALDLNAHLFGEAGPDNVVAYDVGDSQNWGRVVAGGGYAGNLYLLDAGKGQIHKYAPGGSGYPGPSIDYLQTTVDLSAGLDMDIDGHIYILSATGDIKKFLTGEPEPFALTGLDMPLKDPRAIYCTEAVQSAYVADAGEQRIVQFSKEGTFQRQFRYDGQEDPDLFADLRDISVTEGETLARIYVLAGNRLMVFPLPAAGEPLELPPSE